MLLKYTPQQGTSREGLNGNSLGVCPTGEHFIIHTQCGFAGCLDLRPWAKANRYRFRHEESYRAESSTHVRGDGRWYVEILCKNGLIYPYGGTQLLAYAKSRIAPTIAKLPGVHQYQTDGTARVLKFPLERLDEVAAILKPRKRRAVGASPEQLRSMRERQKLLVQVRKSEQGRNLPVKMPSRPYVTITG